MEYANLTDERKKYIEELTQKLRNNHSIDEHIDFESLAEEYHITFVSSDKIAGETAVSIQNKGYVFVPPYFIRPFADFETAHGFGHVILNHSEEMIRQIKENEASYFAEKLTGISHQKALLLELPENILLIITHPLSVLKLLYNSNNDEICQIFHELGEDD